MKLRVAVVFVVAMMMANIYAQTIKDYRFGDVKVKDLETTELATDSDASAVMLLNLRDVYYRIAGEDFVSMTTNHVRIKILKEDAKDLANVSFVLYNNVTANQGHEKVLGLKAAAYNLENGKVVKTKMKGDMVFKEKIGKAQERTKFTIPQVKVGTIIEYEYTVQSDMFWDLSDWYAQQTIPVSYARYTAFIPDWLRFHFEMQGRGWLNNVSADGLLDRKDAVPASNSRTYVMEGRNIPAAKSDEYVYCPTDYFAKVSAELASTFFPGSAYKDCGQTWERIDEMLLGNDWFGGKLDDKSPFADELKQKGIDKIADVEERVAKTVEVLQSHVKWNKEFGLSAKSSSKTAKAGTGNNADINMLLINMLNDVDVKSEPVVMRRRDMGMLPFTYPSIEKLSTFVVAIHISEDKVMYADASGENGYLNAFSSVLYPMRARYLNKKIESNNDKWVDMQCVPMAVVSNTINAAIGADGSLEGDCNTVLRGQSAYVFRTSYNNAKDEKEYVSKMEKSDEVTISDYKATSTKGFAKQSTEKFHFTRSGEGTPDHIYICPFVKRFLKKNPFTDATRLMPVEFPYRQVENSVYTIAIPEGWEVEELPKAIAIATPQQEMIARVVCTEDEGVIQIHSLFKINSSFFSEEKYIAVKEMLGVLAEHGNEMIVLKKKQ